jgi:hypothetical protein
MNTLYPFQSDMRPPFRRDYYHTAYKQKTPQSLAGPVLYRIRFFNLFFSVTRPANGKVTNRHPAVQYFYV